MGHLRLTIGYLKATVVHIRVTLGHLKVTIGNFFSELHPKVRPTCLLDKMDFDDIEISYNLTLGRRKQLTTLTTMKISMKIMNLGKKVRGKDLHWTKNINFNNARIWKKIILSCY